MVPAASMTAGTAPGVLVADVFFRPTSPEEGRFTRADLVFSGVDHSQTSYEVRVFLNNPTADASTPRTAEQGYAGRFVVFGHGGCFGDEGHCEVPSQPRASTDLRLAHPLTPQTKLITVTDALHRVLAEQDEGLRQVTLVPVSKDPSRERRGLTDSLFRFDGLELQTYLTETEEVSTSAQHQPRAEMSRGGHAKQRLDRGRSPIGQRRWVSLVVRRRTQGVAQPAQTLVSMAATAYAQALGERLMQAGDAPMEGGTTPAGDTRRIWPGRSGS